jgi:hypothetical protein
MDVERSRFRGDNRDKVMYRYFLSMSDLLGLRPPYRTFRGYYGQEKNAMRRVSVAVPDRLTANATGRVTVKERSQDEQNHDQESLMASKERKRDSI